MNNESDRLAKISEILNWTNPGPGGFYDDLGDSRQQAASCEGRRIREDPEFRRSALIGFGARRPIRVGGFPGTRDAESLFDAPLRMHYGDLDPSAQYKVRVVYGGDMPRVPIRMVANGNIEIHPYTQKPISGRAGWSSRFRRKRLARKARSRVDASGGLGGNGRGMSGFGSVADSRTGTALGGNCMPEPQWRNPVRARLEAGEPVLGAHCHHEQSRSGGTRRDTGISLSMGRDGALADFSGDAPKYGPGHARVACLRFCPRTCVEFGRPSEFSIRVSRESFSRSLRHRSWHSVQPKLAGIRQWVYAGAGPAWHKHPGPSLTATTIRPIET